MNSILLVDDDEYFRRALRLILEHHKFAVAEAPNGKVARDIMATGTFNLVISDIQMPFLDGLELLEWIKKNKKTPVVLMTGFSQILETTRAFELGASGFLPKPFKEADVLEAIKKILKPEASKPKEKIDYDDQYCKVSIHDFIAGKQIHFSVSVRLSCSNYIKIAHKGEDIDFEKIKTYKSKGINYLYVKKEDYAQLVGFNLKVAKAMGATSAISQEKKVAFMKYTGDVVLELAFSSGINETSFRAAKEFVSNSISLISDDNDMFGLLMNLNDHSDFLYAHALGVSTIAVMIAQNMGWDSPANIFKISLAGMFHDIGKKEISKEILSQPRHLLSAADRALIETHPMRGKDILQSLNSMPSDILQVAYQHHEDCLAQGYPRRLKKSEIHPFAKLIFLSDLFCNYTIKAPNRETCSTVDAIRKIKVYHFGEYDEDMFKALEALTLVTQKTA